MKTEETEVKRMLTQDDLLSATERRRIKKAEKKEEALKIKEILSDKNLLAPFFALLAVLGAFSLIMTGRWALFSVCCICKGAYEGLGTVWVCDQCWNINLAWSVGILLLFFFKVPWVYEIIGPKIKRIKNHLSEKITQ